MTINVVGRVFHGTQYEDHFTGGTGDDAFFMTADNFVTDTVDGGSGNDTVDYSHSSVGVEITLTDPISARGASGGTVEADFPTQIYNPGSGSYITLDHHQVVANLTSIENATGTMFDDVINGNSGANILNGGAGNDVINGGAGEDTITGDIGRDVLTGGSGSDTFVFNGQESTGVLSHDPSSPAYNQPFTVEVLDSTGNASQADVITDFTQGTDHIDLRGIDANIQVSGHQAFNFIGTSQFTGHAGELHDVFVGGTGNGHLVEGDINGDGHADFAVLVQGLEPQHHINASDFLF